MVETAPLTRPEKFMIAIRSSLCRVLAGTALYLAWGVAVPPSAGAYETFGTYRLTFGVVGQKYWIDATAGGQEGGIDLAITRWNSTATPVEYLQTSSKVSSRLDFYKEATVHNWWAATSRYVDQQVLPVPPQSNWWWAKVRLDGEWSLCQNKVGVLGHEVGHAMGLTHVFSGYALMREDIAYLGTNVPVADDISGINFLY